MVCIKILEPTKVSENQDNDKFFKKRNKSEGRHVLALSLDRPLQL